MNTLKLLSPAKLNLHLEILRRRSDHFHDLETLMTTVSIYDQFRFSHETDSPFRLNCWWANGDRIAAEQNKPAGTQHPLGDLPNDQKNLIHQAAQLMKDETLQMPISSESHQLIERPLKIDVMKRIPSGGGLGGASSNAATTLLGLNRFWKLDWSLEKLRCLAARLGSDVPFFIFGKTAICEGRGEIVTPISNRFPSYAVVVRPFASLATPAVFRSLGEIDEQRKSVTPIIDAVKHGDHFQLAKLLFNRLEQAASQLCHWIERLQMEFSNAGSLGHQMTGSGSCYFGLCSNRHSAVKLYHRLQHRKLGIVHLCRCNI